jgi:hypothetical protein
MGQSSGTHGENMEAEGVVVPGTNPAVNSIEDILAQIRTMKSEIDGLQIAYTIQKKKPWYRDVSTLLAVLALAFSFGTTLVSYLRTEAQDIQASRQELRGILQRLSAIPRENLEASKKYAGDPNAIAGIAQLYNQETTMLARQAAEIAKKLPKGLVSATEYYEIAMGLQSSYNLSGASEFLNYAVQSATNLNDELGAIRSIANLDFLTGQPNAGREKYQAALDIFGKYPSFDQYTKVATNVSTELYWATSEATIGQFPSSNQHIDNAARLVDGISVSPGSDALKMQIAQVRQLVARGNQSTPTTPLIPPAIAPVVAPH